MGKVGQMVPSSYADPGGSQYDTADTSCPDELGPVLNKAHNKKKFNSKRGKIKVLRKKNGQTDIILFDKFESRSSYGR